MRRFPLRTLLLMALALIVFGRMWCTTHPPQPPEAARTPVPGTQAPQAAPPNVPLPACHTLDRALLAAVASPEAPQPLAEARQQLSECPEPPVRACELGLALEARAPLAGPFPALRGLLEPLCAKCPAQANPCASLVTQALREGIVSGRAPSPEALGWNLEHAGPGTGAACAAMVRAVLVPAALTNGTVLPVYPYLRDPLAPWCAQEGHLPLALVNAAVIQQGAQAGALTGLAARPTGPVAALSPDTVQGAEAGAHAFDGKERSGVDLGNGVFGKRWEADGALRAQFDPPLKQLVSLRVRAEGAGTLRAIIRLPPGVGLEDPEHGTSFANPTACQFKGTGKWETCELKVPLLEVEALSVFPNLPRISLYEVEARGTR
ncbi:hypothetical protein POL68_05870 [Stigmatella sp. ncwal1]|uniref:Uncharacterized protein n=1 Tax=Stigmatella ashevillensis TaxID=2995309 RepID=A0ABT5D2W6_9BACT|nr:hypothetical protein [Stigmatella ashevillena]MDC0707992.1 hypothetical protein [Stigmatella ashevillena]